MAKSMGSGAGDAANPGSSQRVFEVNLRMRAVKLLARCCFASDNLRVLRSQLSTNEQARPTSKGSVSIAFDFPWRSPPGSRGFLGHPARSRFRPADAQRFLQYIL